MVRARGSHLLRVGARHHLDVLMNKALIHTSCQPTTGPKLGSDPATQQQHIKRGFDKWSTAFDNPVNEEIRETHQTN